MAQTASGVTTRYTQDLAAPLSQILSDGTSTYVYGLERVVGLGASDNTWYITDGLGSVRQTQSQLGAMLSNTTYDPWGQVESGTVTTFGFTGELQQGSNVYLRARWYNAANGAFGSRDPFAGYPEQPYSLAPYQYAYSDPVLYTDPAGAYASVDDRGSSSKPPEECQSANDICGPRPWIPSHLREDIRKQEQRSKDLNWNEYGHECIGNPAAVEIYVTLADGSKAPVCVNAPQTEIALGTTKIRRSKQVTIPQLDSNGVRLGQSSEENEDSICEETDVHLSNSPAAPKIPQGFSKEGFRKFAAAARKLVREANLPHGELAIHGSRVNGNASAKSDIDVILRVDNDTFNKYAQQRLDGTYPGTDLQKTILKEIRKNKLSRFAISSNFNQLLRQHLLPNSPFDIDFSMVVIGSKFDNGPFISLGVVP